MYFVEMNVNKVKWSIWHSQAFQTLILGEVSEYYPSLQTLGLCLYEDFNLKEFAQVKQTGQLSKNEIERIVKEYDVDFHGEVSYKLVNTDFVKFIRENAKTETAGLLFKHIHTIAQIQQYVSSGDWVYANYWENYTSSDDVSGLIVECIEYDHDRPWGFEETVDDNKIPWKFEESTRGKYILYKKA